MDWEHVLTLLQVVNLAQGHPNLKRLRDAALAELEDQTPALEEQEEE